MLRYNITTDRYIKQAADMINRFLYNGHITVEAVVSEDSFRIIYNKKDIISENFDYVEGCRAMSFKEFDRILICLLEEEGCSFDKNNPYYERVMQELDERGHERNSQA
jgi:hypothetical protein